MAKLTRKNFNIFTIVLFVLTGLYIGFIWFHSSMNAEASAAESAGVLGFITGFLKSIGISAELTDHIIRKSAHFVEFALLGFLTFWCSRRLKKKILANLMPVGFVCLATGVIDEYVQLFSAGRSSEVADVLLDFAGSVTGVLSFLLIMAIAALFRKVRL